MGPANTMPKPAPTASSDAMIPTAPATLSCGNSSRMMPKDTGRTPPPTPWITRATMSTSTLVATAASKEPSASASMEMTKIRFLPAMSPSRPMIGVKIEADSR